MTETSEPSPFVDDPAVLASFAAAVIRWGPSAVGKIGPQDKKLSIPFRAAIGAMDLARSLDHVWATRHRRAEKEPASNEGQGW